jgi:hypothetical protein
MASLDGRAELLYAIYERIVVRGAEFISARLTPDAYAMGLALALPEHVRPAQEWVLARPTGVRRGHTHSEFRLIPIEGAEEWNAAIRTSA